MKKNVWKSVDKYYRIWKKRFIIPVVGNFLKSQIANHVQPDRPQGLSGSY